MNTAAMKKVTIMHKLSHVPDARLDTVMTYLETLLHDISIPSSQNQSLKGLWEDAGFEKITNLKQELYTLS